MCNLTSDCCNNPAYIAMFEYFKQRVTASNWMDYVHANIEAYLKQYGFPCPQYVYPLHVGYYELSLRDDFTKYFKAANPSIVIGKSTGYVVDSNTVALMCLYENNASMGYTNGMAKFLGSRYDMSAGICHQDTVDVATPCIHTTAYNLKGKATALVIGQGNFNYGCLESFGCLAGDDCTNRTCTTWGSRISIDTSIPIKPANATVPPAPAILSVGLNISGALPISWLSVNDPTGGEVFAYYVAVLDDVGNPVITGYTEAGLTDVTIGGLTNGKTYSIEVKAISHNNIASPATQVYGTPTGATNPTIFSICWGTSVPTNCGNSPPQPPIIAGTSFKIETDIYNTGPSGKVRCVFKDGTTVISDQNSTLGQYPGGGAWSPYVSFTMPNRNVTLIVDAYGWDGVNWVLAHTVTSTISMSTPTCSSISLSPFTQTVDTGGTVNFTATTTPTTTSFTVNFKLRDGTVLSSKTTTGGIATYTWTTPSTAGTYYVHADVGTPAQCTSTESIIEVSPPIVQHNVNITVVDNVTNNPIQGASVTIGTQTLSTNTSGLVTFLVDEGSRSVSITKTGYNTYSITELVYSDITRTYTLVPVTPTTGSLRFITVPTVADIYFGTTLKGTTDATTGTFSIGDLNAGPISYTVKKTGYNDATGTATVAGGTTTDVPVTLTIVTPTTGDVCLKSTPAGASINIDGTAQAGKTTALSTGGCTTPNIITGLSPGSHSYTLSLTGYQDKTRTFTITAGQVNNVDVGPLTVVTTIGSLTISSSPPGARIYIDDTDSGYVTSITGATISNIPQGDHTYKLTLIGYKDATGPFNITAGGTTTVPTVTLVQRVGTLKFFSTPVGATISIGGVSKGTTTATGLNVSNLPIGPTDYTATLTGYDTYNGTKTVIEDVTTDVTITLTLTTTGKGSLVIETTPPGAEIFIDGVDKQLVTPHTFTGMDVGGHVYQLQKSGYYTVSGTFAITAEETTTITKTLQSTGVVEAGGIGMLFGIVGLAALGMMITAKPKIQHIPPKSEEKSMAR